MEFCTQATLTGAGFAHLQGICALGMYGCRADQVAAARGLGLPLHTHLGFYSDGLSYTFN